MQEITELNRYMQERSGRKRMEVCGQFILTQYKRYFIYVGSRQQAYKLVDRHNLNQVR